MNNEIYELKLIGKTYEIDKNILMKMSTIRTMLEDFSNNESKIIPINRSSLLFDHVIAYVIDDTYPYPLKYFNELDYYGVIYDKSKLYDPHKYSYDKLEVLSKNIAEIKNLSIKIYELENKIQNISKYIYYDLISDEKCFYLNCTNISCLGLYCVEHKNTFKNKCGYKDPDDKKYCNDITDENFKYCTRHSKNGKFCDDKYCRKSRIENSKFCVVHSQ
jgi:hypothetical protein